MQGRRATNRWAPLDARTELHLSTQLHTTPRDLWRHSCPLCGDMRAKTSVWWGLEGAQRPITHRRTSLRGSAPMPSLGELPPRWKSLHLPNVPRLLAPPSLVGTSSHRASPHRMTCNCVLRSDARPSAAGSGPINLQANPHDCPKSGNVGSRKRVWGL
jgi:hypothetical protein